MIPLFKVRMSPVIDEQMSIILHSGYIAQGPKVGELEQAVYEELNLPREPVAVNSGTSAIELALDLIGVGPGDEVITTPMTCFATNVGILRRGAKPVWADVIPYSGLIDPFSVEKAITHKTKAIIGVNWTGIFAHYAALKTFGIPVIEDAAHTWDAFDHTVERGDYIMYSLQAIKFLTAGDGGLLVTPEETHKLARDKRWYGLDRDNNENFRATQDIKTLGAKWNMNDINATIALSNLGLARNSVQRHRENAKYLYQKMIMSMPHYVSPPPWNEFSSYWVFPMLIDGGARDEFEKHMNDRGVQTAQVHFRNDEYYITKDSKKSLPRLDLFSESQTNIPCGWWLDKPELDSIVQAVSEF